jgi:hypothetical protein
MHPHRNLMLSFQISLAASLLAVSVTLIAQQSPGTQTRSQSVPTEEHTDAGSSQPNSGTQSFTVQPMDPDGQAPAFVLQSTTRRVVVDVVLRVRMENL